MKKILTTVIVICLLAAGCLTIFAACGNSGDANHTIYFYSSQGDSLVSETDDAIEAFEAKYPGWTVKHTQPGGYDDVLNQVRSDLTAGLQPDLAYCYSDHVAQYLESGTVVDMNKYLTSTQSYTVETEEGAKTIEHIGFEQSEVDQFIEGYLNEGYASNYTYDAAVTGLTDQSLITLPFVKSTELLYYNPEALAELKVDVPTTWDELWAICAKAKAKWPTCTPLGYDSEANWFITMAEQRGFDYTSADATQHYLFNNDGAKAWLGEIATYFSDDYNYITTQQIYGSYTSGLFIKGPADGGLVFCIGSSGGASNQAGTDFTTEVAPIPGTPVDAQGKPVENEEAANYHHTDYSCISQGPSLVMLTGGNGVADPTEKEIMTFQFVKELLSVKFQSQFARASGYNPMREDVYEDETYKTFLDGKDVKTGDKLTGAKLVVSKAAKTAKELTERFFTSPAFVGSSVARNQMTSVVQYVLLGQKEPARALSDAYKACGGK